MACATQDIHTIIPDIKLLCKECKQPVALGGTVTESTSPSDHPCKSCRPRDGISTPLSLRDVSHSLNEVNDCDKYVTGMAMVNHTLVVAANKSQTLTTFPRNTAINGVYNDMEAQGLAVVSTPASKHVAIANYSTVGDANHLIVTPGDRDTLGNSSSRLDSPPRGVSVMCQPGKPTYLVVTTEKFVQIRNTDCTEVDLGSVKKHAGLRNLPTALHTGDKYFESNELTAQITRQDNKMLLLENADGVRRLFLVAPSLERLPGRECTWHLSMYLSLRSTLIVKDGILILESSARTKRRVTKFNFHDNQVWEYTGQPADGGLGISWSILQDSQGNTLVTDGGNGRIHVLSTEGELLRYLQVDGIKRPTCTHLHTATDGHQYLYVAHGEKKGKQHISVFKYMSESQC